MSSIQSSFDLFSDLKEIGIDLPEDCREVEIKLGFQSPVTIICSILGLGNRCIIKKGFHLVNSEGNKMMSEDFCTLAKETLHLPEGVSKLSVRMAIDEVVTTAVESYTPRGSLSFLEGYKTVSKT